MLLYTEAQLMDEYEYYIRQLHRTTPNYVNIPTLEEFRVAYLKNTIQCYTMEN